MIEFKLPDIGEGIAEGEIVKWLVPENSQVAEHQAVVEVMTDKATVEIPSPAAGRLAKIVAAEGQVVPVGSVIFHLEPAGEAPAPGTSATRAEAPAAPAARRASAPPAGAPAAPAAPAAAAPAPAVPGGGRTIDFKLPDIGEGVAEGEIVRWLVAEGSVVEEHQAVVEVMTDKATVEIPAPAGGRLAKQSVKAGDTVPVGTVLFQLVTAAGAPAAPMPAAVAPTVAAATPAAAAEAERAGAGNGRAGDKVLAVPSARRVARDLGVDLRRVRGSGRHGVVRRADVESYARSAARGEGAGVAPSRPAAAPSGAAAAGATPSAPPPLRGEATRRPFRGVRRKIAEAMVRSKFTAPHFTVVEEIDVSALVALREKAKALGAEQEVRITYMPFLMRAVAIGLTRFPMLNGHLDEQAQEIVNPHEVNLGIATDTPNGLIVPVVRDAGSKGVLQLARELDDLASRTRAGKIKPEELRGSTFSITNAGSIGGTLATPIINFPDIAILGVHRIVKRPGVVETPEGDVIEVRQYMNVSCSVDHRLADGADAARFVSHLRRLLEEPGLLAL